MPINKFTSWAKKFLKPAKPVPKDIHEVTGKIDPGHKVENPSAGSTPSATFRQVGSVPEDQSGFPTQHLGDNK